MAKKAFIFLILILNIIFSKNYNLHPATKSFIIPGWGESSLGYETNKNLFIISEITLIFSSISSYQLSKLIEKEYIAFANEHAGALNISNHQYWVDIGNYMSNQDYDYEHLRLRDEEVGEWDNNSWQWASDNKRSSFERLRIKSDLYKLYSKFLLGGIVLNHIISSIDALYLSKINIESNLSFQKKQNNNHITLNFYF